MSDQAQAKDKTENLEISPKEKDVAETCGITHASKGGWLKGPLGMAICCGAPLLLIAAVSLFGLSLGAIASGALTLAAVLACPLGMYLMMRMMMKNQK
jgi:hypothetical protein